MQFVIPQLLTLIETSPKIKIIQAMVHPLIVINHYRTEQERLALQNGVPPQVAKDIGIIGDLNPGTINIIYHFIGIQLKEPRKEKYISIQKKNKNSFIIITDTFIDLSEEIKTFYAILESKRNRHDEDVKWSVNALKKIEVARMMGIDTTSTTN